MEGRNVDKPMKTTILNSVILLPYSKLSWSLLISRHVAFISEKSVIMKPSTGTHAFIGSMEKYLRKLGVCTPSLGTAMIQKQKHITLIIAES
jgi:hypothetical protein